MDTGKFKTLLLRKRVELETEEAQGREATQTIELDQTRIGRLSRMDALQSQAISAETQRRRQRQIQKIDAALNRIAQGDYGYCTRCGEQIDEARLGVDPAAIQCIGCANKDS